MDYCLGFWGVLLKDFGDCVLKVPTRLKEASLALARHTGRPLRFLASSQIRKEDVARELAAQDHRTDGLIWVLTCVEPCQTFEIHRHRESNRATDIIFRHPEELAGIYPQFLLHGLSTFAGPGPGSGHYLPGGAHG